MNYKYEYKTQDDRATIINNNLSLLLIEEQNITEGNFLIFSDVKPLESQLNDLNNAANIILLKQEEII